MATPLAWEEVAAAAARTGPYPAFGPQDERDRLGRFGDLMAPVLSTRQRLPSSPS